MDPVHCVDSQKQNVKYPRYRTKANTSLIGLCTLDIGSVLITVTPLFQHCAKCARIPSLETNVPILEVVFDAFG